MIEVSREASMDLPEPGSPIRSTWWPPAAATSSARRAPSWPFTSIRSAVERRPATWPGSGGASTLRPVKWFTRSISPGGASTSAAPTQAASGPQLSGQIRPLFWAAAASAAGSAPCTGLISPSRLSSPSATLASTSSAGIRPSAAISASAIGRS